ncbi:hypothetical protein RHMOL_Rhmol13G0133500 [Rhododendron molle]|uniref:Uncharacterized protein n=1 Tax=Rhododendron molle TaxID=49168 RepID=A0ACC0L6S7_RHOML|nr:hypothetical protein RHMOL_Rhmol13G0133500 [Rhododendron molle]
MILTLYASIHTYIYIRCLNLGFREREREDTHELAPLDWSSADSKMAITTPLPPSTPSLLQLPLHSPSPSSRRLIFAASVLPIPWTKRKCSTSPISVKDSSRVRCLAQSTEESQWTDSEALTSDDDDDSGDGEIKVEPRGREDETVPQHSGANSSMRIGTGYSSDTLSLGIREPVYEVFFLHQFLLSTKVVEVKSNGMVSTRKISRRHLLKSSGLRPRDIRSVDPSLWLTNTMPSLLVRENAILLNLGTLRAIAMQESVFIFNYNRKGGKAFIDTLLPRLNPKNMSGGPSMAFELEVVEAALHSRIQRLEHCLMDLEPRVQGLLEVLPNRLTADILEQLRISKQTLVELGSKAGALKQMLLDILEDSHEIRRICIMGRNCTLSKGNDDMECSVPLEKQIAEGADLYICYFIFTHARSHLRTIMMLHRLPLEFDLLFAEEEEEIEMLLENYLQRCESCHGQAERLLDSAKEMEDSIAVNLSSRRLEVSRVELLLQVGTFCVAVGALVAGNSLLMKLFWTMISQFILSCWWYIWHELEVLSRRTCVCILADDGRDNIRCCYCIFPDVYVSQGEESTVSLGRIKYGFNGAFLLRPQILIVISSLALAPVEQYARNYMGICTIVIGLSCSARVAQNSIYSYKITVAAVSIICLKLVISFFLSFFPFFAN